MKRPQENKANNKKQTLSIAVLSRGKIGFAGLGIGTGEPGGRSTPCEIGDKATEENKHLIKMIKQQQTITFYYRQLSP